MTTTSNWQTIERPAEGQAVIFPLTLRYAKAGDMREFPSEGFALTLDGKLRAYRNACPHTGSPLNWTPDHFFSETGKELICATHGALFDPLTGICLSGPCPRGLYTLEVRELGDAVSVPCDDIAH